MQPRPPPPRKYYPQQQPYGYGAPQQYGYGYNNGFGQVRALQARIDAVQYQIRQLDQRRVLRGESARRLRDESRNIERRLRSVSRYGLNGYEASDIQTRIARLEQRVRYAMASRYGYNRYNGYNGYNNQYGSGGRDHGDDRDEGNRYGDEDHHDR